jgi:hypothetical protein
MKLKLMLLVFLYAGLMFGAQRVVLCEEPNYSG